MSKYDEKELKKESKLGPNYKWIALSNTTLGALMAAIDGSIVMIALPAIFNGLGVNPLLPANAGLLLWMLLGYLLVTSVLLVTVGRLSDIFGRVKLYNFGFLVFAISSILIYISTLYISGTNGVISLIILRIFQAVGSSFLFANSAAILTDSFPHNERGMALGINQIAFIGGSIIGLIAGGILAALDWHLVFLVSVPIGIIGAAWSYVALHEISDNAKKHKSLDLPGNITFALGLTLILIGITFSLLPYGNNPTGWTNPIVLESIIIGITLLIAFVYIESKSEDPMFNLKLFNIRAFTAGNISQFLFGISRGGLQFMLIIWLQGIWLPLHGVSFEQTPFWAAIYLLPFMIGFLIVGPVSGWLSDKHGPKLLSTSGLLISAGGFIILSTFTANFNYSIFAIVIFILGAGAGMFASPNTTAIMNSVPPEHRGVASGMRGTFTNASNLFSMGLFFTLLILGLSIALPNAMLTGLTSQGVPKSTATTISQLPAITVIFAAFLGYNPIKTIIPPATLSTMSQQTVKTITGNAFFPNLISKPFMDGMKIVMLAGAALCIIAALISSIRGKQYIHGIA